MADEKIDESGYSGPHEITDDVGDYDDDGAELYALAMSLTKDDDQEYCKGSQHHVVTYPSQAAQYGGGHVQEREAVDDRSSPDIYLHCLQFMKNYFQFINKFSQFIIFS